MRTIPREVLRHGQIHISSDGRMVTISSAGPERTTNIGLSIGEAREVARALLAESGLSTAEEREGVRHALMHLDLPREIDDGIVDYD